MTDRPTGPATAAGQALVDVIDLNLSLNGADWVTSDEAIIAIEAEQKARIFAALPAALAATHPRDWALESDAERMQHFREDAAVLAAAIEKELG